MITALIFNLIVFSLSSSVVNCEEVVFTVKPGSGNKTTELVAILETIGLNLNQSRQTECLNETSTNQCTDFDLKVTNAEGSNIHVGCYTIFNSSCASSSILWNYKGSSFKSIQVTRKLNGTQLEVKLECAENKVLWLNKSVDNRALRFRWNSQMMTPSVIYEWYSASGSNWKFLDTWTDRWQFLIECDYSEAAGVTTNSTDGSATNSSSFFTSISTSVKSTLTANTTANAGELPSTSPTYMNMGAQLLLYILPSVGGFIVIVIIVIISICIYKRYKRKPQAEPPMFNLPSSRAFRDNPGQVYDPTYDHLHEKRSIRNIDQESPYQTNQIGDYHQMDTLPCSTRNVGNTYEDILHTEAKPSDRAIRVNQKNDVGPDISELYTQVRKSKQSIN